MIWLAPLGFLGLLGLVALIVIYIIKPNYQQKMISSTYVWKLSLKYRKKRLPLNRLNNILQFLCQCLILTISALLLANPVIASEKLGDENEVVLIVDASASMLLEDAGTTRFERAIAAAKDQVASTASHSGLVSVILADSDPEYLLQRAATSNTDEIYEKLDSLMEGESRCTYGSANLQGAVALAEEVLRYNSEAQVYLYTATKYLEENGIEVVDVSTENEWNAAVLNCTAKMDENNHYAISIDLGCYGKTELLTVNCQIYGANAAGTTLNPTPKSEFFDPTEEEKTVTFTTDDFGGQPLYSFDYLEVYVAVADSFGDDNSFFLYGGKKPEIKIQYASSIPNNYFSGVIRSMRETMKNTWDIEFTACARDEKGATEGFDLYIFEHTMPDVLPTDGVVLLVDPNKAPDGSGLRIGEAIPVKSDSTLATGTTHDLMKFVDSSRITVAKYNQILSADGYQELAYYNGNPVLLAKNEQNAKVIVWAFDLNYSNLCAIPDFSFMMYNLINYYIPSTLTSSSFEIGDNVAFHARGTELKVTGNGEEHAFDEAEGSMIVNHPGTYTVTQKPMQGDHLIIENFFVKIPSAESNITKEVDALPMMNVERNVELKHEDLLFYFAIALVTFMFAEWYLQSKKTY